MNALLTALGSTVRGGRILVLMGIVMTPEFKQWFTATCTLFGIQDAADHILGFVVGTAGLVMYGARKVAEKQQTPSS